MANMQFPESFQESEISGNIGETEPVNDFPQRMNFGGDIGSTYNIPGIMPAQQSAPTNIDDSGDEDGGGATQIDVNNNGVRPVVGWLVATKGNCKGQDFHLYDGWNRIGRREDMCVYLTDPKVEREGAVKINYFDDDHSFAVSPCEDAKHTAKLNGKAIRALCEIKAYDRIQVGDTELMLIPLCGEQFSWEE